jgi:hypothetical protein
MAFPSTHLAMAAEDALRDEGVPLQVIPLPTWIAAGCGLAIRLQAEDAPRAEEVLRRRAINVRGVHEEAI